MKNFKFLIVTIVAVMFTGIVGCSSDSNEEPTVSDIVGTWEITEVSADNSTYIDWPYERTSATFNADGSYSGRGYFGAGSGTWEQDGNTIVTYIKGEEFLRYEVLNMTSTTCTLEMSMTGSSSKLYIKCVKH